jgi:hypothetical protein
LDARLTTLLCKKIIVAESKEVNTGWFTNLAEYSKENYDSKAGGLSNDDVCIKIFNVFIYL